MWSKNSKENIELISVTMVTSLEAVLGESHELDGGEYCDRFEFTETRASTPQRGLPQGQDS